MCVPPILFLRFALLSGLFLLLTACGNPSSQSSLNSLSVKVTPATVTVGGAATLQASAHLSDGTTQDVTSSTQWTISNNSLATLSNGVLTSKAPGNLTVQAAYIMAATAGQSSWSSAPQTLNSSAQLTITASGAAAATPSITWSTPQAIPYGTTLGSASLDATASVPGSFTYTPAAGTVLKAGTQTLTATFTPSDTATYAVSTAMVQLTVTPASPLITWTPPSPVQQGTAISATQLNAVANVPGSFSYSPAAGTVVVAGTQPLTAAFTPNDATDYMPATAHTSLTVNASQTGKSTPLVTWPTPVAIEYGTALNSVQLDATASVPGSFAYTPAAGTVLKAGTQTLTAIFTPSEATTYSTTTATVQLTVNQATAAISWKPLAAVTRATALTAAQLDATANVPGKFSYNPGAGYVPPSGTLQLAVTFTPTDTTDYNSATAHNSLTIGSANTAKSTPSVSWSAPAAISYGTALSSIQLNATANAPGSFAYTPAAGSVLKAGTQTLSATLTPSNTTTYSSTTVTVQLTVNHVAPAITWAPAAAITQGAALTATQLDAKANVPGTFSYSPGAGNIPTAGTLQMTAAFTPTDTTDYTSATAHNSLVVVATGNPIPPANPPPANPPTGCGGPTINLNSGMSQSTLSSTISSAPNCALILFAAGVYNLSATINVPCSVSLAGPTVPLAIYKGSDGFIRMGYTPTATVNWSGSNSAAAFSWGACATAHLFEYLEVNMNNPSPDGGQALYFNPGQSNVTVEYNYFHGNQGSTTSTNLYDGLVLFDGSASSTVDTNIVVEWNRFGASTDCSNIMSNTSYSGYTGNGGFCVGLGNHNGMNGYTVKNNDFYHMEQGMKTFEAEGVCLSCLIAYNDYSNIHRINYETQSNIYPGNTVSMTVEYNSIHDPVYAGAGTMGFSVANGCSNNNPSSAGCVTQTNYNVIIQNVTPQSPFSGLGIEQWGSTGSGANYNLVQGEWSNSIMIAQDGAVSDSNNHIQSSYGAGGSNTPADCAPGNAGGSGGYGWWNVEDSPANTPSGSGNQCDFLDGSAQASAMPTISPATGSFTGSQVITFTNTGANRDANTGIWYTTDGTTPVPGSGTAQYIASGGAMTATATTTVKAVGMWGAQNQPTSYASGYGYAPSAVASATYTALAAAVKGPVANLRSAVGATDTIAAAQITTPGSGAVAELSSVAIVPAQPTVDIGSTIQLKAVATFSDGSTRDVTTDFAWSSSDTRTITAASSGLLSGLATGNATITGSYQGQQASVPALSNIGEINWSGPIVITEAGTYSGNWQSTDSRTPAVTVATTAPVVIENAHISSVAGLIKTSVAGADVTVRNSVALAVNSAVKGQANGVFLDASSPARLDIENNYVENAGGGVLVHGYSGNRDGQQTVVIRANRARNLNGLLSDGNGAYLPGVGSNRSVSNFIELDKVQAVPGIDVGWNEVINYPGRSLVADNIAVKSSSGTPNQPLEIHDSYIQGAYPYTAAQADYDGGGIKTEGSPNDNAQQAPAFNSIHDNQVVGTANYGIEFTAGHDNIATKNRVISSGMLADGARIAAQQVGMANGDINGANANLYNNSMQDNLIGWACWASSCSLSGYRRDQSFPAAPGDYSANTIVAQPITLAMEDNEYQIWLDKTATAGIAVGPAF